MTHNDVLRSLRYLLNINDRAMADIVRLDGHELGDDQMVALLRKEDEEGYLECSHRVMAHFLRGLIVHRRGRDESRPPQPLELPLTNNAILKGLRIAFELKDDDVIAIAESGGMKVSKTELGAFFRRPDHRNYRDCGDQFLRNFLRGLRGSSGLADR